MSIASKRPKTASIQELLEEALRSKSAADVGGSTSSQVKAPNEDKPVVEGERAKEHDAVNKEVYGETGTTSDSYEAAESGHLNPPMNSSKVAPAGEDPKSEDKATSLPSGIDPGTSLPGTELGGSTLDATSKKVAAWRDKAASLFAEFIDGVNETTETPVEDKTASEQNSDSSVQETEASDLGIYGELANGDPELAKAAFVRVTEEVNLARQFGIDQARKVAAYLASEAAEMQKNHSKKANQKVIKKRANMSPEEEAMLMQAMQQEGGEDPMAAQEGMVPEAGMEGEPADEEALIEEALMELAEEMGMSPEELTQMLMAASAGEGGEGGEMAAADPMAAAEPKMAADKLRKEAKANVKKEARKLVEEQVNRARRK
jgi:hypothetical protein